MKKNNKKIGVIYVISQARHKEGTTGNDLMSGKFEYKTCIKIGFTTNWENRSTQYKCNCVNTTVLFTISDKTITMEDEFRLHKYFRKYKVKDRRGKEWFDWSDEIIKFFQTHSIISDIREVLDSKNISNYLNSRVKSSYINRITNIISDVIYDGPSIENLSDLESILKALDDSDFSTVDEIFDYLEFDLGIEKDKVSRIRKKYDRIGEDEKVFSSYLKEFKKKPTYRDKLKYLCEGIVDVGVREKILDSIPFSFKNAYLILGPEKLKALSYQKSRIVGEYNRLQSYSSFDIYQKVHDRFKVGDKVLLSTLKESLRAIFDECGRKGIKVKANDIERWFTVKYQKISVNGKQERGVKIISDLG